MLRILRDIPDEIILWRYMDIHRLNSLIMNSAIHFTPAYILRDLEPYELRIPVQLFNSAKENWITNYKNQFPGDIDVDPAQLFDSFHQSSEDNFLYGWGISCWHINNFENSALWRIYVPDGGVVIKTTLGKLKKSFSTDNSFITGDIVEYIDYRSESFKQHPNASGFEALYHKAKFYAYENEFRLAYHFERNLKEFEINKSLVNVLSKRQLNSIISKLNNEKESFLKVGPFVKVDLCNLFEEIIVGPIQQAKNFALVSNLINQNLNMQIPIKCSSIDKW